MRRRSYCAVVGCLLTGVAGCSGLTGNQSEAETPTPPATSTSTPEGEPELSLEELSVPARVEQPNADVPIRIEVQNTGSVEGFFSEPIGRGILDKGDIELEPAEIELSVPPGNKVTKSITLDVSGSGFIEIRVGSLKRKVLVFPRDPAPQIRATNLINGWSQYGDVASKSIQKVEAETEVALGVRYYYWHIDGLQDLQFSASIYNSDNQRIGVTEFGSDVITDDKGWAVWERGIPFVSPQEPGEYFAELVLRDRKSGAASSASVGFTIVD